MAGVLITVAVGVADEGGLEVVVEVVVGEGDKVRGVGDVKEAVIEVLVVVPVGRQVAVVDPDVLGGLDADGVTVVSEDLGDLHVADDDVVGLVDVEANTLDRTARLAVDGLVRRHADLLGPAERPRHDDNGRLVRLGRLLQAGHVRHRDGAAGGAARGATILRAEADVAGVRCAVGGVAAVLASYDVANLRSRDAGEGVGGKGNGSG